MELDLLNLLGRASIVVFLVLALVGLHRKWWVPGWYYRDLEERHSRIKERLDRAEENADAWKEAALTGTRIAKESTSIASAAVERGRQIGR